MKKMKILSINDRGYLLGGLELNVLAKNNGLKDRGYSAKVFTSDINPFNVPLYSDYTFRGFDEKSPKKWLNQIVNFNSYSRLRKVLKEYKPDIIHIHNIACQVSPSILLAVGNIPTILTLHSYELLCPTGALAKEDGSRCVSPGKHDLRCTGSIKGYVYETIKQFIHRILLKKILLYTVPSKSMKVDFDGQKIISSPIRVLYNGVDLSEYKPIKNFNRILYVGRISKEKGVETLIRAFEIIKNACPDVCLDIVGDGPEMDSLNDLCDKLNLKDSVQFYGKIDKKNIVDFYIKSTFIVVPSICPETFCRVGVEALSVGRPVIGSDFGAIPEWLVDGKCGFLFTPGSVKDLAAKSIALLKNKPLLEKMSKFGHEYSKNFSVDANTNNFENLYLDLVYKK